MPLHLGWVAAGAAAVALSAPAGAADVAALYQAYWAGMPAGEVRLTLHDEAGRYRDEIEIRADGLPLLMTRFHAVAIAEGRQADPLPAPQRYDARYSLRKARDRRLVMQFVPRGAATIADRGPGDSSRKPPLPARFRTNVLDPLSALDAIRDALRRGNRGPIAVPVFDGARRFDVVARVMPKEPDDKDLHLRLVLSPIAGFKGETSDDGDPDNAPLPARLTLTDDTRLMPLSMEVSLDGLPLDIELKHWCGESGNGRGDGAAACR
jgi:hypothetical protein